MPEKQKVYRRHMRAFRVIKPLVTPFFRWRFNIRALPAPSIEGPCLVVANHNSDLDATLIHLSFNSLLYFVASEHIFRFGLLSRLLVRYFDPISRLKGSTDMSTVMKIIRRLRDGKKICIFAEGNRSFNGLTCPIPSSTGKLARYCGVPLITYKFEGGYLTTPRWADTMRRGRMKGYPVNVYSPQQLKAMSDDEVNAAITLDLYEDAYARQAKEKVRFKGKRLAKGLEQALYLCPQCGRFGELHSHGNVFSCTCGLRAEYDEYGFLHGSPYRTVTEWDAWQHDKLALIASELGESPAFTDQKARLLRVRSDHTSELLQEGSLSMYRDRIELGDRVFLIRDIGDMAIYGKANIAFYVNPEHFEIKADSPFCGRKYLDLYNILKDVEKHGKTDSQ